MAVDAGRRLFLGKDGSTGGCVRMKLSSFWELSFPSIYVQGFVCDDTHHRLGSGGKGRQHTARATEVGSNIWVAVDKVAHELLLAYGIVEAAHFLWWPRGNERLCRSQGTQPVLLQLWASNRAISPCSSVSGTAWLQSPIPCVRQRS